ncbi:MAG: spore coat protein CotJB [Halanaerobium sp.]|nr:spore coat protein CotJB [Halanaerobium sp.]
MDGRCSCGDLLLEVQALTFAMIDLNLYLNTHPLDQRALQLHNQYVERYRIISRQYEEACGMLMPTETSCFPWEWINEPWPWEMEF